MGFHVKRPLILSNCNETRIFLQIKKKFTYQISGKFFQWEPSFPMRTDGRTERRTDRHDEANNNLFSQFCDTCLKIKIRNGVNFTVNCDLRCLYGICL